MFFISNSSFLMSVCVCVLVSHLYGFGLLDAESMVKEAERWKQVPSQHECVEVAPIQLSRYRTNCTARLLHFESGLPFIPPLLSSISVSHLFLHSLLFPCTSALCFLPPLSSPPLTMCLYSFPPSPVSWQNYSSRLAADVCVWEYRLPERAPAARCLRGACRRPCYHHSQSARRPFHYAHVTFGHRVAAAV